MMTKLTVKLGLHHDSYTPYNLQEIGQVEVVNKVFTTMIKRIVRIHKKNWHLMPFLALWAYHTSAKTSTGFTPFQLAYYKEATFPIECEISSLKLAI